MITFGGSLLIGTENSVPVSFPAVSYFPHTSMRSLFAGPPSHSNYHIAQTTTTNNTLACRRYHPPPNGQFRRWKGCKISEGGPSLERHITYAFLFFHYPSADQNDDHTARKLCGSTSCYFSNQCSEHEQNTSHAVLAPPLHPEP